MIEENVDSVAISESSVVGLRDLKRVFEVLGRLDSSGVERDHAGNRKLLFSHYAGLVLLGMFNPTLQSLRGLSQLSELKKVQKALGSSRASLGSLSESTTVFDPVLLEPIIAELVKKVPTGQRGGPRPIPDDLARRLTAVDGSVLKILPQMVAAASSDKGHWRMHLHFDVWRGIPAQAKVLKDGVGGDADERSVLRDTLEPGRTYVIDAGFERYALFQQIVDAGSDYVCRVQQRAVEVVETRPLSAAAVAAGIVSDEVVQLGHSRAGVGEVRHSVRRIVVRGVAAPARKRSDRTRSPDIVILTNLLDVPAEVLAEIYRQRWVIELFFRFFKHVLRCNTLLSTKSEGIAIQVYCALIASLLLSLTTQQNYGRRAFELICLYFQGWADEEELLAGIKRLQAANTNKRRK